MMGVNIALIVGSNGLVGSSLKSYLKILPDWKYYAVSKRKPLHGNESNSIECNLLIEKDCEKIYQKIYNSTHLFYTVFKSDNDKSVEVDENYTMLKNMVNVFIENKNQSLQHIQLLQGSKWYGNHLGPYQTPAKEGDSRHMPPNFYFDQQEFIEKETGKNLWSWTALRPHGICGFSVRSPMNLLNSIALYSLISKELDLPLRFPGSEKAYKKIYQATDVNLLSKAMLWAATSKKTKNQEFNITNGDFFRWSQIWPLIAKYFNMKLGDVQKISLKEFMADKGPVWDNIVKKNNLIKYSYGDLVNWSFADFSFNCEYDVMSNTTKSRLYGWNEWVDSSSMFERLFGEMRKNKIIP